MFEQLVKQIMLRQREIADATMQFPFERHEAYQRIVGRYEGLSEALSMIEGIVNAADEDPNY